MNDITNKMKKYFLFVLIIPFLLSSLLYGQRSEQIIEGKTFVVQVYEYNPDGKKTGIPLQDELTFVGGKMYSKTMSKEFQFSQGDYNVKIDSSGAKNIISFISINKRNNEEVIIWQGAITGNEIKGSMKWFAMGMTKIFFGTLKYKDQEK